MSLVRIRRLSRTMEYFTTMLLAFIPLTLALVWLFFDQIALSIANLSPAQVAAETLPLTVRVFGFFICMIPTGIVLYGLIQLRLLFRHYRAGHIFTDYALTRLRRFAWALLIVGLLRPLAGGALSVLLSFNNPPGQRVLALGLSSNDVALLFISGVFLVIVWIMAEGVKLADDSAQIV